MLFCVKFFIFSVVFVMFFYGCETQSNCGVGVFEERVQKRNFGCQREEGENDIKQLKEISTIS